MIVVKWSILILILLTSSKLGLLLANRYKARVTNLKDIKVALNILKTKIDYTYQPLPDIFMEISNKFQNEIGDIFEVASNSMKEMQAGDAWKFALDSCKTSMKQDDIGILKNLEKLLGKTDVYGQLSEIEVIENFVEAQIIIAEEEKKKNEKLYRNLGVIVGLAVAIILV